MAMKMRPRSGWIEKVRDVETPLYGTQDAACADLFCPTDETVPPHGTRMLPLGVRFHLDTDCHVLLFPRSSLLTKTGLLATVSVIDNDYDGEVHCQVYNTADREVAVKKGSRLCQAMLLKLEMRLGSCEESTETRYGGSGHTGGIEIAKA